MVENKEIEEELEEDEDAEEDEEEELEEIEEKEAKNKCAKNEMDTENNEHVDNIKEMVYNSSKEVKSLYISQRDRLELGNNY